MVYGFIYVRIGAGNGGVIDARSPNCPRDISSAAIDAAFAAVPDLADGDLKVDHIICDVTNTIAAATTSSPPLSPAVVCIRTHPAPVDPSALNLINSSAGSATRASIPTVVVTCLMSDNGVPTDVLRGEVSALNDFAGACVNATSKPVCEAIFATLLNPDDPATVRHQSTLLSAASRSPSGLPRCVRERAVPLAFCFVPPGALGGASMGEANEFLDRNVPALLQERQKELHGSMPWNRDDVLTEHLVDVLRVCSNFVADAMRSDVSDLLECRQACELIPPHPSALDPTDPKYRSSLAHAHINANASAQGAFFGRGVWFSGLFAADGAVVSSTGGFFRLPMEEQVIVSTLVSQCNASGDLSTSCACEGGPVKETHFFPDVIGQVRNQNQSTTTGGGVRRTAATAASTVHAAAALPPMITVSETQVQFHPDTPNQAAFRAVNNSGHNSSSSSSNSGGNNNSLFLPPVEGSIIIFVLDEHLRFVVGIPRHHALVGSGGGGAVQRTTGEISLWAQQLLDNSLQVVSAREVSKYCSAQQGTEEGAFGFCMRCCGAAPTDTSGVPYSGLRRISYLTPGLLRHYSVVIATAVARSKRSCRYFSIGPDGSSAVRLLEAAAFAEHRPGGGAGGAAASGTNGVLRNLPANSASLASAAAKSSGQQQRSSNNSLRYFVQVNRTAAASSSNNAASRYMLAADGGNDGAGAGQHHSYFYETALGRPSSLLNAHAWREMLKFSELVLMDTVAPVNGLTLGLAASRNNFSVVSLTSAVGTSAATTAEQFQMQTAKAVETAKAVHASLQVIAAAAIKAATTPSLFVIAAAAQANHAAPPATRTNP